MKEDLEVKATLYDPKMESIEIRSRTHIGFIDVGSKRYLVRLPYILNEDKVAKIHIYSVLMKLFETAQKNEINIPEVKLRYRQNK